MTVTFCGHRTLEHPVQVKSWLREVVCDLIGQGANIFLLGGYGAFDLTLEVEITSGRLSWIEYFRAKIQATRYA